MTTFVAWCISLALVTPMAIASVLLRGWVLSILWAWFMVPIFGAPTLSVSAALGIALIVNFLTHQHQPTPEGEVWARVAGQLFGPIFALAMGWIIKGFM